MDKKENFTFGITQGKGFYVRFDNGVTLSTQFGSGNYCANRNYSDYARPTSDIFCSNAEIGIWDKAHDWLTKQAYNELFNENLADDVDGYIDVNKWLKLVNWCANYSAS